MPAAVIRDGKEFLGTQSREAIAAQHLSRPVFQQTLSTVIDGDRRMFAVTDVAGKEGSAGIAADMSAVEAIREEYERRSCAAMPTRSTSSTTAVAIFDADQKLRFYNQAFQKLWDLDAGFLAQRARQCAAARPPAQRAQAARAAGMAALEGEPACPPIAPSTRRSICGTCRTARRIRVVANPQPKGGVTWVFENLTEKIDLESRYNTAVRVQGETLDNLSEGVAVFGPDGRIRLSNPAFGQLWGVSADALQPSTHISAIRGLRATRAPTTARGADFVATITGFDDERRDRHGQTRTEQRHRCSTTPSSICPTAR